MLLLLLLGLPLLPKALDGHETVLLAGVALAASQEDGECGFAEELRVLGCLGPAADWATAALHPPFADPENACRHYSDFRICASVVPDECRRRTAGALENVYEVRLAFPFLVGEGEESRLR